MPLVGVGGGRTPQDRGGGGSGPAYTDCHGNATVLSPDACSPTPRVARRVPLRPGLGAANQWELMSLLLGPRARHHTDDTVTITALTGQNHCLWGPCVRP